MNRPRVPAGTRAGSGCRDHRPALAALAMAGVRGATRVDSAALDHLARCRTCEVEVGQALRARLALERTWQKARTIEPAADAWPRLRARVERRAGPVSRAASSVLGLALGAGLSMALLLPVVAQRPAPDAVNEAGINQSALLAAGRLDAAAEARWLRSTAKAGKEAPSPVVTGVLTRADLARYAEAPAVEPARRVPRAKVTSVE